MTPPIFPLASHSIKMGINEIFLPAGIRLKTEGFGLVAVEQHIEYKRELRAGDLLTIRSSILAGKEKAVRFKHEMRNDQTGEVAATMLVVGVCIDATVRKARALPRDIRERIASLVQTQA